MQVVGDAVQQAVAAAIEDGTLVGSLWDWHANVYTLVAITGVVLFWRGLWTLWCISSPISSNASIVFSIQQYKMNICYYLE